MERSVHKSQLTVSEIMAECLIKEILAEGNAPKEVRLRHLGRALAGVEDIRLRIKELVGKVAKGQGEAALKKIASEGSKALVKALDAYGILLVEGGKYLEGKNALPPSFSHIFKGSDTALLCAVILMWNNKTDSEREMVIVDLMIQEFWAAFFREAKGTHYYKTRGLTTWGRGRKGGYLDTLIKIVHADRVYVIRGAASQQVRGPALIRVSCSALGWNGSITFRVEPGGDLLMSLDFRRGDGTGLRNPHGGVIQALRQGPAGGLGLGEGRWNRTPLHVAVDVKRIPSYDKEASGDCLTEVPPRDLAFKAVWLIWSPGTVGMERFVHKLQITVSEIMAELAIAERMLKEILAEGSAPKEARLRHLGRALAGVEDIRLRVKELVGRVAKGQGEAALMKFASEGSKALVKALDAYGILLVEGAKHLEEKDVLPPSFSYNFKGPGTVLLPDVILMWDNKTDSERELLIADLMLQEFWAAFYRDAKGTHYYKTRGLMAWSRRRRGGYRDTLIKVARANRVYDNGEVASQQARGFVPIKVSGSMPRLNGLITSRVELVGVLLMSLEFRRGDGAGLRNPHGGGVQAIRQGPAGGLEPGERRQSRIPLHEAPQPHEESFPLILYSLNNVIICFRWIRMGEVSRKISELISDSANKGKPAGVIRREVINWCLGNVSHDDAALQEWLKPQLIARQEMRTVKFNSNHLVQAMRVWDLQPLVVRNSG